MPKLDDEAAEKVGEAEGFKPLEEGLYWGTLQEVRVSEKPGKSGYDYWTAEFGDLKHHAPGEDHDGDTVPGKQWANLSLSPKAEWKMKEFFDAFGAEPNVDTDELLGLPVILFIEQREIEEGPRMGQLSNQISAIYNPDTFEASNDEGEPEEEPKPKAKAKVGSKK